MTWVLILTAALTACSGGDSAREETLAAENGTLSTEIAYRRMTATIGAEQIRVTSEALGTAMRGAQDRQQSMVRTLDALGIPVGDVSQITPIITPPTPRAGEGNRSGESGDGGITLIPPTQQAPEATPTAIPPAITQPPTIDLTLPNLVEVSVSSSVGDDDCATGSAAQFTVSTPELYAVGRAVNFPVGMSVTFNWLREGEVVYSDTFTWDSAVDDACVWYFVTPQDFAFTPGAYTVTFERDGVAVALPVSFTLVEG
jgi:hypothetical protein